MAAVPAGRTVNGEVWCSPCRECSRQVCRQDRAKTARGSATSYLWRERSGWLPLCGNPVCVPRAAAWHDQHTRAGALLRLRVACTLRAVMLQHHEPRGETYEQQQPSPPDSVYSRATPLRRAGRVYVCACACGALDCSRVAVADCAGARAPVPACALSAA